MTYKQQQLCENTQVLDMTNCCTRSSLLIQQMCSAVRTNVYTLLQNFTIISAFQKLQYQLQYFSFPTKNTVLYDIKKRNIQAITSTTTNPTKTEQSLHFGKREAGKLIFHSGAKKDQSMARQIWCLVENNWNL